MLRHFPLKLQTGNVYDFPTDKYLKGRGQADMGTVRRNLSVFAGIYWYAFFSSLFCCDELLKFIQKFLDVPRLFPVSRSRCSTVAADVASKNSNTSIESFIPHYHIFNFSHPPQNPIFFSIKDVMQCS
jgi:hypothetical protein